MIRFLTDEIVQAIHDDQVRLYGGTYGLRDEGLLSSALSMPQAQFGGQFLHASIFEMAAAYCFHLSQNQPFLDGNKRVAGMVMLTFLKLNGMEPIAAEDEYYEAMMAVANKHMSKAELAIWLQAAVSGTPPALD